MREMKDSGVEWIGEIPVNWNRSRLGYVCDEFIVPMRDKPQKFNGDIPWCRIEDIEGKYINGSKSNQYVSQETIDELNLKVYPVGTIINSCSATIGVSAIVTRPLCTNQTFIGLVAGDRINNIFLFWLMNALGDYQKFTGHGSTITYISQDKYRKMEIPLPNISEQKRIADYLDTKCAKIDSIIEKQQAIIEKLREYKLSVITEAVLKGLNQNVQMKHSNNDKIGLIPADWSMIKMSMVCDTITDYVASGSFADLADNVEYLDEPDYAMLIRTADVSGKGYESKPVYINQHAYEFLSNSNLFGGEIILPNIGASVGDVYIVPKLYERMSLAPNSIMLKTNYVDKYYYYFFMSDVGRMSLLEMAQSATQPKFNKTQLRQMRVPVPKEEEQAKIVEYLDGIVSDIDSKISKMEFMQVKLVEYKKSMIYEVVTGKKEV